MRIPYGARRPDGRAVKALVRLPGDDVDHAAEAALVPDIEGPRGCFDPVDLGEIDVERGRIHVVGAGAVDPLPVDQHVDVLAGESPQDDVVGDAPLPDFPHPVDPRQGLAEIAGRAFPGFGGLEGASGGRADHGDDFLNGGERKLEIQDAALAVSEPDRRDDLGLETRRLGYDVIGARSEALDTECSGQAGYDALRAARRRFAE